MRRALPAALALTAVVALACGADAWGIGLLIMARIEML